MRRDARPSEPSRTPAITRAVIARTFDRQRETLQALERTAPGSRLREHERSERMREWVSLELEVLACEGPRVAREWLAIALAEGLIFNCRETQDASRWVLTVQTKVFA